MDIWPKFANVLFWTAGKVCYIISILGGRGGGGGGKPLFRSTTRLYCMGSECLNVQNIQKAIINFIYLFNQFL